MKKRPIRSISIWFSCKATIKETIPRTTDEFTVIVSSPSALWGLSSLGLCLTYWIQYFVKSQWFHFSFLCHKGSNWVAPHLHFVHCFQHAFSLVAYFPMYQPFLCSSFCNLYCLLKRNIKTQTVKHLWHVHFSSHIGTRNEFTRTYAKSLKHLKEKEDLQKQWGCRQ